MDRAATTLAPDCRQAPQEHAAHPEHEEAAQAGRQLDGHDAARAGAAEAAEAAVAAAGDRSRGRQQQQQLMQGGCILLDLRLRFGCGFSTCVLQFRCALVCVLLRCVPQCMCSVFSTPLLSRAVFETNWPCGMSSLLLQGAAGPLLVWNRWRPPGLHGLARRVQHVLAACACTDIGVMLACFDQHPTHAATCTGRRQVSPQALGVSHCRADAPYGASR